jgi:hypothetical protein
MSQKSKMWNTSATTASLGETLRQWLYLRSLREHSSMAASSKSEPVFTLYVCPQRLGGCGYFGVEQEGEMLVWTKHRPFLPPGFDTKEKLCPGCIRELMIIYHQVCPICGRWNYVNNGHGHGWVDPPIPSGLKHSSRYVKCDKC